MSNKIPVGQGTKKRTPSARVAAAPAATKVTSTAPPGDPSGPARPESPKGAAKKAAIPARAPKQTDASKRTARGKVPKQSPRLRPQLVRDSFTMPEADFAFIAILKSKALDARRATKKSELLRAGLRVLAALNSMALVAALDDLEPVKTGRPKKGR
jgi:hypothetical protein